MATTLTYKNSRWLADTISDNGLLPAYSKMLKSHTNYLFFKKIYKKFASINHCRNASDYIAITWDRHYLNIHKVLYS